MKKEKEMIEEMKKDVKELIKKEEDPGSKERVTKILRINLKKAETSEDVLKEIVKKQKEIRLKEQRLAEKKELLKIRYSQMR